MKKTLTDSFFQNGASNNLLSAELDIWSKAYIDVNEIVKQNILLRTEVDSFILQVKSLKEKCGGLEKSRVNDQTKTRHEWPRDGDGWVEGRSDTESSESVEDGEIIGNRNKIFRNNNKVIISCNNKYVSAFTPITQSQMTTSGSDRSSCLSSLEIEKQEDREERKKSENHSWA